MSRQPFVLGVLIGLALAVGARAEERDVDQRVVVEIDRNLPEVRFTGQGLVDVIDFLRDVTGTNIFVDWHALEAAGISKETPVKLQAKDVKLRHALKQILDQVGTDKGKAEFTIRDGVLVISTVPDPAHPRAAVTVAKLPPRLDRNLPEVNFNGQALSDVLDFLGDVSGSKLTPDWTSLESAGISKDSPVVLRVKDLKYATALWLVLESVTDGKSAIDCAFADNTIKITAKPAAKTEGAKKSPN